MKTHLLSHTRLYNIWSKMKGRCYNKNRPNYKYYGGKGITVCNKWKNSFEDFYIWANNNGYKEGLTLDRKKNNLNYCPSNCKWSTVEEQNRNKTNCKWWIVEGKTYTSAQKAADAFGVSKKAIIRWCYGYKCRGKFYPPKPNCSSILKHETKPND